MYCILYTTERHGEVFDTYCKTDRLVVVRHHKIFILERLRYPDSGLRVRVSPFCLPIFADVSIFTRNFYPFPRGKRWSTRKRQTGTGVFCLLIVGRLNSKKLQHITQINNVHMLVKVFNNLWRTSTAKVTILSLVFSRRNILDFLSYKSFPDLRVRVRVYHPYP